MASFSTSGALAKIIDDHIEWFMAWHRLAFLDAAPRAEQARALQAPSGFDAWRRNAAASLPQDQPVMDRLAAAHDQLHKLARLILIKTPDGQPPETQDYDALAAKFTAFMQGVRQLERAFAVAASGLDPLTGLRSRLDMHEDLAREQSRYLRGGKPFCVAIMDIDHFKAVNDTHGHDAGDRVLAAVADHVSRHLRAFDDAYRMGGEEFMLCLKEADTAAGLAVLERMRLGLEQLAIALPDGASLRITASFGLAPARPDIAVENLLRRADQALYRAKNGGRNRVAMAET